MVPLMLLSLIPGIGYQYGVLGCIGHGVWGTRYGVNAMGYRLWNIRYRVCGYRAWGIEYGVIGYRL